MCLVSKPSANRGRQPDHHATTRPVQGATNQRRHRVAQPHTQGVGQLPVWNVLTHGFDFTQQLTEGGKNLVLTSPEQAMGPVFGIRLCAECSIFR
jgi:hypothetical protein